MDFAATTNNDHNGSDDNNNNGSDRELVTMHPYQTTLKRNAHVNYFMRCLTALPTAAEGHDSNRYAKVVDCNPRNN